MKNLDLFCVFKKSLTVDFEIQKKKSQQQII